MTQETYIAGLTEALDAEYGIAFLEPRKYMLCSVYAGDITPLGDFDTLEALRADCRADDIKPEWFLD